ncbi:MAG: hypothetical protein OI717_00170 (plasmid) [Candidatus Methanoperedens sp.]|nr:MAG: hypothetical protein OI717_00170 [Candidatus Methanoperedens sp.]
MSIEPKSKITFAQTEREKIREHFTRRASEAPIPNPFDAASLKVWDEYVQEMHELEQQLREAGEPL